MVEAGPVGRQALPAHELHEVRQHAGHGHAVGQQVHGADIAADGEEQPVPEAEDPEIAPDQIQRHGEDREGGELTHRVDEIRGGRCHEEPDRGREAEPDEAGDQGIAHGAASRSGGGGEGGLHGAAHRRRRTANSPSGRRCRNRMMPTSTITLAATAPEIGSISTLAPPTPTAATRVPTRLPTPPSTTTMKLSTMKPEPMPGLTL